MSHSIDHAPPTSATTLRAVIDQSERIQDNVEECAVDLTHVNEVMKAHLATPIQSEVATVLRESESIEAKVQSAADELAQVNEALSSEVQERKALGAALEASRQRERAALDAALHDPLTGLANRTLFDDRLAHGLAQAKRYDRTLAVMFIDLDGFKAINDARGHEVGDQVLIGVAERLLGMTRAEDTVGRLGGDEFLYLVSELTSLDAATLIAKKIHDGVCAPIPITGGDAVSVQCSLGVSIYPADAETGPALVQRADEAMYRAKRAGGGVRFAESVATRPARRSEGTRARSATFKRRPAAKAKGSTV